MYFIIVPRYFLPDTGTKAPKSLKSKKHENKN